MVAALVLVVVGAVFSTSRGGVAHVLGTKNMAMATDSDGVIPEGDISVVDNYIAPSSLSCSTINGRDLRGNDIRHIGHVPSLTQCQNACKLNAECRCYTYKASSDDCWLKRGPCDNYSNNGALQSGLCRGRNRGSMQCTVNVNSDLPGSDIASLTNIGSLSTCQTRCRNNLNCRCYTYQASSKRCWLKTGQCTNYRYGHALQSGICASDCY